MVEAVEKAIVSGRHLVVSAGTGTGKTLAYLVPSVLSHRRVVVATATKALQDQLAAKDVPVVQAGLRPFSFAVLKGRSNYLCVQRLAESRVGGEQGAFGTTDDAPGSSRSTPERLSPGRRGPRPAIEPSSSPSPTRVCGRRSASRPTSVPARTAVLVGRSVSPSERGPPPRRRTSSPSTITCSAPTWRAKARPFPNTTCWSSMRRTLSKTR